MGDATPAAASAPRGQPIPRKKGTIVSSTVSATALGVLARILVPAGIAGSSS